MPFPTTIKSFIIDSYLRKSGVPDNYNKIEQTRQTNRLNSPAGFAKISGKFSGAGAGFGNLAPEYTALIRVKIRRMIILANPIDALLAMVAILVVIVLLLCWIIYRHTRVLKDVANFLRIIAVNYQKPDGE
ncbi:MAG: hypothetical protein OXI88_19790 [Gammaproteobacteria bacterium]|nr:hypothetical protein [Gammaproteobacteria bacterium]